MATIISVDYDFLVPHRIYQKIELPDGEKVPGIMIYDWTMGEGGNTMLEMVKWETRALNFKLWGLDIQEEMKLTPDPLDFIASVSGHVGGNYVPAYNADSHAWGAILAKDYSRHLGPLDVVNFDAHHDLGYFGGGYGEKLKTLTIDDVDCGNWALWALMQGHIQNYTLVYPDWLGTVEMPEARLRELEKAFPGQISVTTWKEFLAGDEIDDLEVAFFCRSSGWVPPWLDGGFQTLLDEWGYVECLDCAHGLMCSAYDSCKAREWDWRIVQERLDEREAQVKLLTGRLKIG